MKKITRTVMGLIMLTGLIFVTSCDKIESLADVKFDAELQGDVNVMIPTGGEKSAMAEEYAFSESISIDPRQDPDIDEYFDKLKKFEVQEVTGTVKTVTGGPVVITSASITISSADETVSWPIPHFTIESGNSLTFGNDDGQWDKVNKILNEKKAFTVTLAGMSDKDGISFTFNVLIKVKVTANPL